MRLTDDQWLLYKESPIWVKEDKHGQAYTVLLNDRSKEMGKVMGVPDIHRDKRCLACHTGFPIDQMPFDKNGLADGSLETDIKVNVGVSCEGCHGPAGDRPVAGRATIKGWMGPHQIQPLPPYEKTKPWRFLAPRTKKQKYGFWDVRSPLGKSMICASCHIGDLEKGRFVTHEMFAAGHPPLPGFEIETFVQQMPRHWRELADKADKIRNEFLQFTRDELYREKTYQQENLHRTKTALVGAVVSLASYLKLTGQLADEQVDSPVSRPPWPELAQFECFSCHHDLKSPGWRKFRKLRVPIPGRPLIREWTTALIPLALQAAGADDAEFNRRLKAIRLTLAAQPFGNKDELKTHAYALANWLFSRGERLQKKPLTRPDGSKILKGIAAIAATEILDYDSARQLVWAFKIVHGELKTSSSTIQRVLEAFEKDTFLLDLRRGRKTATPIPGEKSARITIEVDLAKVLAPIRDYDPGKFRERFREISKVLNGPAQ